jgi:hypothetical protein
MANRSLDIPRRTVAGCALTEQEHRALVAIAREQDTSVSRIIRRALIASGVIAAEQQDTVA